MSLVEHSGAAKRPAARPATTGPERPRIESEVFRTHPERPGELRPTVSFTHFTLSFHKASAAPLDANDSTGDISLRPKLYRAIYRRKFPSLACSRGFRWRE